MIMKQWDDIHNNFQKITEKIRNLGNIRQTSEIFKRAGEQLFEFGDISYVLSCTIDNSSDTLQIEGVCGINSKLEFALNEIFKQNEAPSMQDKSKQA